MLSDLKLLMRKIHDWSKGIGWWEGGVENRSLGDQFANFHAELSEAWEEYRKFGVDRPSLLYYVDGKPEGIAAELGDLIIRVLDTCEAYQIPLIQAINEKMAYNETRPYRHGNKLA